MGSQTGVNSAYPMAPHTHTAVDGGLLDPEVALFPQPKTDFGDGSDGNYIVGGGGLNYDMTRDMSWNNLTVLAGFYLQTHGFKLKVKGKLTIDAGGIVYCPGAPGAAGAAGLGGAGGTVQVAGRRPQHSLPTVGGKGGDSGGVGVDDASGGGITPNVHMAHPTADVSLLNEGRLWSGAGGGGGGAVGVAPTDGETPKAVLAGAKGGVGWTALLVGGANHNFGGGGGGAGGGMIEIWAHELENNGTITANGGGGGAGEGDANAQAGGGGGGGGGAILIYYQLLTGVGLGIRQAQGGLGGGSFGGLADGLPGEDGFYYNMKVAS